MGKRNPGDMGSGATKPAWKGVRKGGVESKREHYQKVFSKKVFSGLIIFLITSKQRHEMKE